MDRETFLARTSKPQTREVTLEDGTAVKIRKLSQAEVERIRKDFSSETKALEGFRYVVSRCVVDDNGERVFRDEDQAKLLEVDYDAISLIANEVVDFSGLNRDPKKR